MGNQISSLIDLERVMEAALERGCYLELNSKAERLDLDDVYCKLAKEMGLNVAISTDAHETGRPSNSRIYSIFPPFCRPFARAIRKTAIFQRAA